MGSEAYLKFVEHNHSDSYCRHVCNFIFQNNISYKVIGMFIICLHTICHISSSSDPFVTAVKVKVKYFHTDSMFF
jgi:hypothetical protein